MTLPGSHQEFFDALLRIPIIQIFRAAGFHSMKASTLDVITEIAGRYINLLATKAKDRAELDNTTVPNLHHVRLAMQDVGLLVPSTTATEDAWREALRRPLETFPEGAVRDKEKQRRDEEDTVAIRNFIAWVEGPINKEIIRVAGMERDENGNRPDDFVTGKSTSLSINTPIIPVQGSRHKMR
jgi:transcription initiation factor TFIID subunit 3